MSYIKQTPILGVKAANYYGALGTGVSTATPAAGNLRLHPILLPVCTLDRIGVETTGAGSTGALIRLGIYKALGNGFPGALLLDAGTVAATTVAWQEITISQAITEPGYYFLGYVCQGAPVTAPTVRTIVSNQSMPSPSAPSYLRSCFDAYSITGALPNPFTTTPNLDSGDFPFVMVRAA